MDALELPEPCLEMAAVYQSLEIANFFQRLLSFKHQIVKVTPNEIQIYYNEHIKIYISQ